MAEHDMAIDDAVNQFHDARRLPVESARRYQDPLLDSCSVAATVVGDSIHPPDPEIERDLGPVESVAAASGLLTWRVRLSGRWSRRAVVPLVHRTASGYQALLPSRGLIVESPGRNSTRLRAGSAPTGTATAVSADLPADTRWWRLAAWSLRRRRSDLGWLLVWGVLGGTAGLILPLATGAIFESAVPDGDTARVVGILAVLAVASIALAVLALARGALIVRIRDTMDSLLSPALFGRLLRLRPAFFRANSTGDIANRALSVENARQQVDDNVVSMIVTSAFGLMNIVYLLVADLTVGLIMLAVLILLLLFSVRLQVTVRDRLPAVLAARSRSDSTLLSLLEALPAWRVSGAEDRALTRWARDQSASTRAAIRRLHAVVATGPNEMATPTVVLAVFVATVILLPGRYLQPGSATAPGVFLALYAAVAQLTVALMALTAQSVTLTELGPSLQRMEPIATAEREPKGAHPGVLVGGLGMEKVTFGYRPDRPPLFDGLTLSVNPGEFVAVVGPSGSGKSTLLRLLLGFEIPWRGSVTFDGQDLNGLDVAGVRRQLGVVLQSSQPLGDTIRECVRGPRNLSDDRVWELLENAGMADDVHRMPQGLATEVGDRGLRISGGQRQRLAIAAALAGRPRILLFDEATSALDNRTQAVVMRTVLDSSVTRFVIAHRMSTVQQADRILVVSDGRITEEGSPAELLAAGGHFARLAARQEL